MGGRNLSLGSTKLVIKSWGSGMLSDTLNPFLGAQKSQATDSHIPPEPLGREGWATFPACFKSCLNLHRARTHRAPELRVTPGSLGLRTQRWASMGAHFNLLQVSAPLTCTLRPAETVNHLPRSPSSDPWAQSYG